jgi:transposase-like protein
MVFQEVHCKYCSGANVKRHGSQSGHPRCRCNECGRTFQLSYTNRANEAGVKEAIVEMALNGSGIRDTARVLGVAKNTVSAHLKKSRRGAPGQPADA